MEYPKVLLIMLLYYCSKSITNYCNWIQIKHVTHFPPPPTNQIWNTKLVNALVANQVMSFHIFGLGWKNSAVLNRSEFCKRKGNTIFPKMTFLDITVKILCDRKKIAGMIKLLVYLMEFSFSALTSTSPSQNLVK